MSIEAFYCVMREIGTAVHDRVQVSDVVNRVVKNAAELLNAKGTLLQIVNPETHVLELDASYGLSERYLSKRPFADSKIVADLCRQNQIVIIKDILGDPRVELPREAWEDGIRMMVDAPVFLGNRVLGMMRILYAEPRDLSDDALNLLAFTANQSACAIDKARLIETQQSKYQHLALQTEKLSALGRMAAGIAHEINNPLAGVLLYATNLLKKAPNEGPFKEGLEVIVHETIRCKSIIQELLEFSREREPHKVLTNINDIIEKALSILENEFRLKHIRVEKRLSSDMQSILLDENQIEQVFVNLLINAVEAVRDQGSITVQSHLDPTENCVRVEIADTGSGIPPEHMERIFEPFFSSKEKGTGLGLSVTYGIVRNHGGEIKATSEPGEGTCFTIDFPTVDVITSKEKSGQGERSH